MFDNFQEFLASIDIGTQGPGLIVGLALGVATFSILKAATRKRSRLDDDDEWRDPPPLIYKLFKPVVRMFARDVRGFINEKQYKALSQRLSAGGMNYAILPEEFVTLRWVCLIVGTVTAIFLYSVNEGLGAEALVIVILAVPIGFLYPDLWLNDKIRYRRRIVEKDFPFLLDLLVLSMRAGLNYSSSLGQAIASLPPGPVRDEFGKLLREIRAGKVRRDALSDLGERMNIPSVNNFVAAMNQAEETGGEIVEVLTLQAEQKRSERFSAAEEQANKAPVKMLLPMMLFLFPIVFMLVAFIMVVKLAETNLLPEFLVRLLV
ncbi:MAG: type II secretion system F family protein [Ketobacteraceae bacterium]|nr:type II secretion system F family protein [Ketobacteraceae bacterium]